MTVPNAILAMPTVLPVISPVNWPLEIFKALMGLGGFAGVVLTLFLTSRSARKAIKRQADEDLGRRQEGLMVLKTAVLASLFSLDMMIDGEIEYLRNEYTTGTWVPLLDYFETYRENLDKLGHLQKDQVRSLAQVYFKYQECAGYIARKSGLEAGKPIPGLFAAFHGENFQIYKEEIIEDLSSVSKRVKTAILSLEHKDGDAFNGKNE